MKAVVLKTDGKRAAVLDGDGSVRIIENRNYSRGQVLELVEQVLPMEDGTPVYEYEDRAVKKGTIASISRFIYRHASQAAAVAAVLIIAGGMSVYAAPVKTVISTTTPSLSYKLNVFDRVVRVEAAGDNEEELPEELLTGVAGKTFDQAVDIALDTLEKAQQGKEEESPEEQTLPEEGEPLIQEQPEEPLKENSGMETAMPFKAPESDTTDADSGASGDDREDIDKEDENDKGNDGASFGMPDTPENKINSTDIPQTAAGQPESGSGTDTPGQAPDTSPSGAAPVVAEPSGAMDNTDLFVAIPGINNGNANSAIPDIAPPNGYGTGTQSTGGSDSENTHEAGGDHAPEGGHSDGGDHAEGGERGGDAPERVHKAAVA